jgi:polysaccharide pyruvyl transferase WcaK-like protein
MERKKYIIVLEYGTENIGDSISNIVEMLNSIKIRQLAS